MVICVMGSRMMREGREEEVYRSGVGRWCQGWWQQILNGVFLLGFCRVTVHL